MVKRIACGVVVLSLLMLWPVAAAVAEEGKVKMIALMEELHVFPGKAKEYEGLVKEQKKAAIAHGFPYRFDSYRMDDLRYLTIWWIDGSAGVDKMWAAWEALAEAWGEEAYTAWAKRMYAAMSHADTSLWIPRPDLSYSPENQADEFKYVVWGLLPVKPGHQKAVEELFKEYAKVFAEHEVPHAWSTAEGYIGVEYPTLGFVEWAATPGSYWMRHDENMKNEELSEETDALWAKLLPRIRGFEWVAGYYLKELSYRPQKKVEETEEN